ncbi:IclR family transcriptional regulator C-terminal domain-containing protein [Paralimibaculum aggregatum]|uniref:IclR family transcriptional regulator C-terminal domain-containing protein n=1 Tax=Paralimibaculum aggregatum TaxID=3036245 RepID=A0ABQ6LSS3_9RHOB|nr:IclR family transcriptional regulator [Limibaculum sp. NKW23]GMG85125.1 IclR family transcriptional regulator C-terminal domain-containing protein [Limibaculum sp. NKW23]
MTSERPPIDKRLFVTSAEKCLTVLAAFRRSSTPLGLKEIARLSGLDISATQRFVYTLRALDYLRQDPATKRYSPTVRVLDLSYAYLSNSALIDCASPYLREAHRQTDESINLVELEGLDIIYVARIPSRKAIATEMACGSRLPAYCSGSGRAILAHLPEAQATAILEASDRLPLTPHTITDLDAIRALFPRIRETGYAVNYQECYVGDLSLAAPIFDRSGRPAASVNISLNMLRWTLEDALKHCTPVLVETATAISRALGAQR